MKPAVEGVGDQAQPSERALALQPGRDVVRQGDDLVGGGQRELTRVQDERLIALGLDQPGQVRLLDGGVDVGVLVVLEHPEVAVEPNVDTGRLDHLRVVGLDGHTPGFDLGPDVLV
jgi:hypothetical protein